VKNYKTFLDKKYFSHIFIFYLKQNQTLNEVLNDS